MPNVFYATQMDILVQKSGATPLYFVDDFGDNLISSRRREISNHVPFLGSLIFRPEWTEIILSDVYDAAQGFLSMDVTAGQEGHLRADSNLAYGTWVWNAQDEVVPPYRNHVYFQPIFVGLGNYYYASLGVWNNNDASQFGKRVGGLWTENMIDATWAPDNDWTVVKLTRAANNTWEMFIDGVSQGTVIDDKWTTSSYVSVWLCNYGTGKKVHADNIALSR